MVVLMDGGTGGASNIHGRQPDPLRKRRSNERHYVFDVAFGADSTQVDYILTFCNVFVIISRKFKWGHLPQSAFTII